MTPLDRLRLEYVHPSRLLRNPVQPPRRDTVRATTKLLATIKETGYAKPIVVTPVPGTNHFCIIDGHRTLACLRADGQTEVAVLIVDHRVSFQAVNGVQKNLAGQDWGYVWASALNREESLRNTPPTTARYIRELVAIIGEPLLADFMLRRTVGPNAMEYVNKFTVILRHCGIVYDLRAITLFVLSGKGVQGVIMRAFKQDNPRKHTTALWKLFQTWGRQGCPSFWEVPEDY